MIGGFLLMFNYGLFASCLGYFTVPVTEAIGISRSAFTSINTIQLFVGAFCTPIIVKTLVSKWGETKFTILSGFICAIGFIGFSISKNIAAFYAFAVLIGIFYVAQTTINMSNSVTKWFTTNAGTPVGICWAGSNVTTMVMGMILPTFIAKNGWRAGYLVQAVFCVIIAIIGALLIKGNPEDYAGYTASETTTDKTTGVSNTSNQEGLTFKEAVRSPKFYLFMVAVFLTAFMCNFMSQLPAFLTDKNVTAVMLAAIMSLVSSVMIASKIGLGVLSDIIGKRVAITFAMLCYALSFVLLRIDGTAMLYVAGVFLGIGMASATVFNPLIAKDTFGAKEYGQIFAVINGASVIGGGLGGPAWGLVFDLTGSYNLGMVIAPLAIIIACVICVSLAKPKAKKLK